MSLETEKTVKEAVRLADSVEMRRMALLELIKTDLEMRWRADHAGWVPSPVLALVPM